MKNTINDVFDKVFVFFQNQNEFFWTESYNNKILEDVLKKFEEIGDIPMLDQEVVNEDTKLALIKIFCMNNIPVPLPISDLSKAEIISTSSTT